MATTAYEIWCDVLDANGAVLGPGPIMTVMSVTFDRGLDMAGTVNVALPLHDKRASDLIQRERRLRFYVMEDGRTSRDLGTMIVRTVRRERTDGGASLRVDGPGELKELADRNLWRNFIYGDPSGATIEAVLSEIIGYAPGWSVAVDNAISLNLISGRFDGVSVLEAIKFIAKETGNHFRQTPNQKVVEFGPMGVSSGIRLITAALHPDIEGNDAVGLWTNLTATEDSEDVYNVLIPLASGEGSAAITLDESTRTVPYPIVDIAGQGSQTFKGIQDDASIALYGERHKILTAKNITPTSNTEAAKVAAANQLYDFSAVALARNGVGAMTYRLSASKVRRTLFAGDKIRLEAQEEVEAFSLDGRSEGFIPLDVDDDFWIVEASEQIDLGGSSYRLGLSNVDQAVQSVEQTVVDAIREMELSKLAVRTAPFFDSYMLYDTIGGAPNLSDYDTYSYYKSANFRVVANSLITSVAAGFIRFKTFPITATSLYNTVAGVNFFTASQSGIYPKSVYLYIDGVNVTDDYGGPWNPAPGNSQIDVQIDVSDYFEGANLHTTKTFEFRCVQGNYAQPTTVPVFATGSVDNVYGQIEFALTLIGSTQAILPS